MGEAIGVYGDVEMVSAWWVPLEKAGLTVTLRRNGHRPYGFSHFDRPLFDGFVSKPGIRVTVNAGAIWGHGDPPRGTPVVFVMFGAYFRKARERRLRFAEEICEILVSAGFQRLPDPM